MSDHTWILENLAAYLAGGLEPAERERLEQHTAECSTCAAALSAARDMDANLSALFAEARPNAALEDRAIQSLRTRLLQGGWRLPLPGWLLSAAAALLLLGFTGAVASQIIAEGGLAFPGTSEDRPTDSVGGTLLGYRVEREPAVDAVEQKAQEVREKALKDLDEDAVRTPQTPDPGWNATHSGDVTKSRSSSTTYNRPAPVDDADKSARVFMGDGKMPAGGQGKGGGMGTGMGGMMGMAGGMPGMSPMSGSGGQPGMSNMPPLATMYPQTATATNGQQPFYFEPGKTLPTLTELRNNTATKNAKDSTARDINGRSEVKGAPGGRPEEEGAKEKKPDDKPAAKTPPQQQDGPRKIVIRTGEIEYEVQSFDAAVATVTRLVKNIKGGFIATVNSDKLANGKVRGSITVRLPPEHLDELVLDLRVNLGKGGELKNQRIHSADITKQYTDLESRLKAGRAMEERLLQIIKNGKGEIKDLLAVEKELGEWRTRIEELEGSLRYYANQVALSTLTITLYEKEMQAALGLIERENVQMGIEVEDVDEALRTAQKAVTDAKGRITRSELKQPSQGQFSAVLHFEVAPDAAGPLRDRLKQLGTVARFDITRTEETEGGTGKPQDGKRTRKDTRFQVHFYNLTNVAPRETVQINLACIDVEVALKTLLTRIDKAAGRIVSSNLNSTRGDQGQATLLFEVKTPLADAVLADVKAAGEVMRLNVLESPDAQNTTRKKRGFHVQLMSLSAATPRETDEMQLACADVATSYRALQEVVLKAKGRVRNAQLNEQDRRNITALLDVEVPRSEEAVLRTALTAAGDIYTRKTSRAADAENVVDSKVRWQVSFLNQASIPPRETYIFGIEVADVDRTAATLTALAGERQGRTIQADVSRERNGRVTGLLVYDVPMTKVHELMDQLRAAGTVRVQKSAKHPEVPDSPLAVARVEVTLSNSELIVPSDEGIGASVRRGLSDSFKILAWSLRLLIFGLCIVLPWALVLWGTYRLIVRMRRRAAAATPQV